MQNKSYSLHIGLNSVNPATETYDGWDGRLNSSEADAIAMKSITDSLGYDYSKILLTKEATRNAFFKHIIEIQEQIQPGDLFVLTFSGHGSQVMDSKSGFYDEEEDGHDETWCFYDAMVLDDEIYEILKRFSKGVRVLVISDSCHSGDMLKGEEEDALMWGVSKRIDLEGVEASVRLISSCQEFQLSREAGKYGLFTKALLYVWRKGKFEGDYFDFYKAIVTEVPTVHGQTPNHLMGGAEDEEFDRSKPFIV